MGDNEDSKNDVVHDFKFKEFEMRVDSYRYYLTIALQVNVFFYFTTGAVLGFYLTGSKEQPANNFLEFLLSSSGTKAQPPNNHLEYFLLLPILIGAVLGGIFLYAARLQKRAADTIETIRGELIKKKIDIREIPDLDLLYILLRIFGWIFFLVGLGLIAVPFLKVAAFPRHLIIFAGIAVLVLITGGRLTYSIAHKLDRKLKRQRTVNNAKKK